MGDLVEGAIIAWPVVVTVLLCCAASGATVSICLEKKRADSKKVKFVSNEDPKGGSMYDILTEVAFPKDVEGHTEAEESSSQVIQQASSSVNVTMTSKQSRRSKSKRPSNASRQTTSTTPSSSSPDRGGKERGSRKRRSIKEPLGSLGAAPRQSRATQSAKRNKDQPSKPKPKPATAKDHPTSNSNEPAKPPKITSGTISAYCL